jgi:hypothetical protein
VSPTSSPCVSHRTLVPPRDGVPHPGRASGSGSWPFFTGKYLWWETEPSSSPANTWDGDPFSRPMPVTFIFIPVDRVGARLSPLTRSPGVRRWMVLVGPVPRLGPLSTDSTRAPERACRSSLWRWSSSNPPRGGLFSLTTPSGRSARRSLSSFWPRGGAAPLTPVGWTVFFILCLTGPFIIFLAPFWWLKNGSKASSAMTRPAPLGSFSVGTLQGFLTVRLGRLTLGSIGSVMGVGSARGVTAHLWADDRFSALMALLFWDAWPPRPCDPYVRRRLAPNIGTSRPSCRRARHRPRRGECL